MDVDFYDAHLDTLVELKTIAERHNAKIRFGFQNSGNTDFNADILCEKGFTETLCDELTEKAETRDVSYDESAVWFELYEKESDTYSSLRYSESSLSFYAEFCAYIDEPSDELEAALEGIRSEYDDDWYHIFDIKTVMYGFGKERIEDNRVYRSGMALKFFADLVCDYFNEARIERNY